MMGFFQYEYPVLGRWLLWMKASCDGNVDTMVGGTYSLGERV